MNNFDKIKATLSSVQTKLPKQSWDDKVFYDKYTETLEEVETIIDSIEYKNYIEYKYIQKLERALACLIDILEYPDGNSDEDPDALFEMSVARNMLLDAVDENREYEFVHEYFDIKKNHEYAEDFDNA